MKNFFKGIFVGLGGIAPGLSGSVLLVIFGLYQKTITAIGTLFKDLKKNILFLLPIILGAGIGILLFSKIIDFLLNNYEMYTRFSFLGLIFGTIPLFYKEVKKEGFNPKFYVVILISFLIGFGLFFFNRNLFPTITEPNIFQSILLGVAVAGSSIVPGIDSAVILSTLGLYEIYVSSLANLNLSVLLPALLGVVFGALFISFVISYLLKKYYTTVFSIVFGLFLAIIPNILNNSCALGFNISSFISIVFMFICFSISLFLGKIEENKDLLKKFSKYKNKLLNKNNLSNLEEQ